MLKIADDFAFEGEQSQFNAALATLERIHEIKKYLAVATIKRDYDMKYKVLKSYYAELLGILKDTDEIELDKLERENDDNYFLFENLLKRGKRTIPRKMMIKIDEWEKKLRNTEQTYGMNLPKKEDARTAMMSIK